MFSRIRRRFTYANVVMTLALVFAMSGGAYAAGKYLITSTKQISPKVLASLKGAAGKNGTNGAPGSPGVQGAAGTKGETGPQGPEGKEGKAGSNGGVGPAGPTGPKGATGPKGETGENGEEGHKGSAGPTGPEGSPWTDKGMLPNGSTEKGAWSATGESAVIPHTGSLNGIMTSINFPIPLETAPTPTFIDEEQGEGEESELKPFPSGCKGNATKPEAKPGNLCIFVGYKSNVIEPTIPGSIYGPEANPIGAGTGQTSTTGALLLIKKENAGPQLAYGTWAVTGT